MQGKSLCDICKGVAAITGNLFHGKKDWVKFAGEQWCFLNKVELKVI